MLASFISNPIQSGEKSDELKSSASNVVADLYTTCKLQQCMSYEVFLKSYQGFLKYHPVKPILVVCDFTKPSTEKRFYVIDLEQKKVIFSTLVAHGKNSGELYAESFSNEPESHKSCSGFLKISDRIVSPKHGTALLLEGLEKNINDNARMREIIIHGANYVSEDFIAKNGRLGRSFGCPALPNEDMEKVAPYLANGALLYINAK